jgi:hypothetical protein
LVQLGIRQARYFGRQKTLFQLLMAATVANLTLVASAGASVPITHALSQALRSLLKRLWRPIWGCFRSRVSSSTVALARPAFVPEFSHWSSASLEMAVSRPGL